MKFKISTEDIMDQNRPERKERGYNRLLLFIYLLVFSQGCSNNKLEYDASGIIESDEIIVSSEVTGRLIEFKAVEGSVLVKDSIIARIEPLQYKLQSEQLEESIDAVMSRTLSSEPQIKILEAQAEVQRQQLGLAKRKVNIVLYEQTRIQKLHANNAATGKQLDDINNEVILARKQMDIAESQIALTKRQIQSQKDLVKIQNRGILSEQEILKKRKQAADDLLAKTEIKNPVSGTVLKRYVNNGELLTVGKPMYKLADMQNIYLKVYISGSQLTSIKLNQEADIFVDYGNEEVKNYKGHIVWISDKAEFTPKTIQTADERANLVYAIKVHIKNDGYLKLGMFAEIMFN